MKIVNKFKILIKRFIKVKNKFKTNLRKYLSKLNENDKENIAEVFQLITFVFVIISLFFYFWL